MLPKWPWTNWENSLYEMPRRNLECTEVEIPWLESKETIKRNKINEQHKIFNLGFSTRLMISLFVFCFILSRSQCQGPLLQTNWIKAWMKCDAQRRSANILYHQVGAESFDTLFYFPAAFALIRFAKFPRCSSRMYTFWEKYDILRAK